MWILIIVAIFVIWHIGLKATVKGTVNGVKKTRDYIVKNRKNREIQ